MLGILGKESWPVAVERCTCPVELPTAISGATGLMLVTAAFESKYRPDAPESTIAVDDNGGSYS